MYLLNKNYVQHKSGKADLFMDFFEKIIEADGNFLLWIQENVRTPILNNIFSFITSLGNSGMVWIVIALFLLIQKKTRKIGIMCILGLVLSVLINNEILKNIVCRPRPFNAIHGLTSLAFPKDFSFPSGHTGSSFAAAIVIFRNLPKKLGIPSLVLAFMIAVSRLYIGVHYPTDVICGVITGAVCAFLAEFIVNTIAKKLTQRISANSDF